MEKKREKKEKKIYAGMRANEGTSQQNEREQISCSDIIPEAVREPLGKSA